MTHTLTIYGPNVRISVQTKDLRTKAAAEVVAHFKQTISQALLDAPHVGVMREHQVLEAELGPALDPRRNQPATPPIKKTQAPLKEAARAAKAILSPKKTRKKAR